MITPMLYCNLTPPFFPLSLCLPHRHAQRADQGARSTAKGGAPQEHGRSEAAGQSRLGRCRGCRCHHEHAYRPRARGRVPQRPPADGQRQPERTGWPDHEGWRACLLIQQCFSKRVVQRARGRLLPACPHPPGQWIAAGRSRFLPHPRAPDLLRVASGLPRLLLLQEGPQPEPRQVRVTGEAHHLDAGETAIAPRIRTPATVASRGSFSLF
jgi:hypothetical protein